MGEQTLTIIGFPNRFQIFRANNPSDVFTQKCLCTTQEYFLPLDKKSSEIEELEIRRKKRINTSLTVNRSREDRFVPVGPRQTYLHANRFSKRGGRLRTRAWVPFDWQNEWGRVVFRRLGQCYHTCRTRQV